MNYVSSQGAGTFFGSVSWIFCQIFGVIQISSILEAIIIAISTTVTSYFVTRFLKNRDKRNGRRT